MKSGIPHRIFYMWCGSEKTLDVKMCLFSWQQQMPDFEIIELNETSKQWFDFKSELKNNDWFKAVYERKMWGFVADYIRFKVLYEHGGIWLDTDVSVIKSFAPLMENGIFLGRENPKHVETAIIGAVAKHPLLEKTLDFYKTEIWNTAIYTSPMILTKMLKEHYHLPEEMNDILSFQDIKIYPETYFYPLPLRGAKPKCTEDSYAIHWWKASWNRTEIKNWLNHKHIWGKEKALKVKPNPYRKVYLLGFIPIGRYEYEQHRFTFCGIPILDLKILPHKEVVKAFCFIPILKLK